MTFPRMIRSAVVAAGAAILLTLASTSQTFAQSGPYSTQIQRALVSFLATAHTWTASQLISTGRWGTTLHLGGLSFDGTTSRILAPDGGAYFIVSNGQVTVNSANFTIASAGTSDIFLRRSAANTLAIDTDGALGPLALLDVRASAIDLGKVNGAPVRLSGAGFLVFNTRTHIGTTADKLLQVLDSAEATGTEVNNGTPTLGACTGGTMTSGSHNIAGEVTGNTSGSCIINFGTPNFTNTPFCFANDETTLTAVRISARSASSITVTGAVSGDAFQFFCIGRIGT